MSNLDSSSAYKVGGDDQMSDGEVTPPPQLSLAELDPPLLQIIDEDSLDIVMNPLTGEATMSGISRRAAHKRFQVLGHDLIRFTALRFLWDKYPMDSGPAVQTKRDLFCRTHQLAVFAKLYRLTTEWRDYELSATDLEKSYASVFEAYVGAATIEMPINRVDEWVYRICKSYGDETPPVQETVLAAASMPPPPQPGPPLSSNSTFPPTALVQMGYNFQQPYHQYGQPPPPREAPPPLPGHNNPNIKQEPQEYHPSMPMLPPRPHYHQQPPPPGMLPQMAPHLPYYAQPGYRQTPVFQTLMSKVSGSLAALRQKATQLKKEVSFTETAVGPDHQKQWTCALLVDHIEVGVGTASSKQVAKDMAAQQALVRLNWI